MTSSEKSTKAAPSKAARSEQVTSWVIAATLLLGTVAIVAGYGARFSIASGFLVLAWFAIVATGALLVRAAAVFDATPASHLAGDLEAVSEQRRVELVQEKKLVLKAIKEIEFDHGMGKLDERDFQDVTTRYRARAMEIMRLLDEDKRDYSAVIYKELAKRLQKTGGGAAAEMVATTTEPQATTPAPSDERVAASRVCQSCATGNDGDATFCKKCGTRFEGLT